MGNCKSKNNLPVDDVAELPFIVAGSGNSSHKEGHFERTISVPGSPASLYHDDMCSYSSYSYRSSPNRKKVSKSKRRIFKRRGRKKDQSDSESSDEDNAGPQDHASSANINDDSFDYGGDSVTLYQVSVNFVNLTARYSDSDE